MWIPNPVVYEGLVSGMLKGLVIGLVSVLLIWAAAEVVEKVVRTKMRRHSQAQTLKK